MLTAENLIAEWLALPQASLVDRVRQLVKQHDARAREAWTAVRGHPVLAARVRGTLSALRAETRGTRDEVMWLMWINQARQELDRVPAAGGEPALETRPGQDADDSATADALDERPLTLTVSPSTVSHSTSSGVAPLTFQAPRP
ncbi:hypothetical protein [Kutzneria sp. NPDC051319]|uniref:hypothetical protein n=1 Tax=Kutzneria sp. NPDC051319 TaxID=3155047 RepID=UPI003413AEC4